MPVPRRRHSTARRDRRRTHHKMAVPAISECPKCHQPRPPHHICPHCGNYKDRDYKVVVTE